MFSIRTKIFRPKVLQGFLVFVLLLANLPATGLWFITWRYAIQDPGGILLKCLIAVGSLLWLIPLVVIFYDLTRADLLKAYFLAWKKRKVLQAFILLAFISIFWSVAPLISAYKLWILLAVSLFGSYIGLRLNQARWFNLLLWLGALVLFLSIAFALILPGFGTMLVSPYNGAWSGIFWHRNQLGSFLALVNAVFLMMGILGFRKEPLRFGLAAVLYFVSLVTILLTDSAAGAMITVALNFTIIVLVAWLKLARQLKWAHYLGLLGLFLVGAILVAANLDFVFALFNRTSTLTGRVPMWAYLFQNVVARNPWLGYGFGAIWSTPSFSGGMRQAVGWKFPIFIGDNGFIDILLHTGLVGLALFLCMFIQAWLRSIRHALQQRTLLDFLPMILMFFVLLANVSFSLLLETESFVWLWIIAVLFMPEPLLGRAQPTGSESDLLDAAN